MKKYDVIIVGAGASGLFCAFHAAQRGCSVLLIDHNSRIAEKIRISGGGRCNFTNAALETHRANHYYVGENTQFCRSALSRFTNHDFIAWVQSHGIAYHEKHKGQLFCDQSSQQIIDALLKECQKAHVIRWQPCKISKIEAIQGKNAENSDEITRKALQKETSNTLKNTLNPSEDQGQATVFYQLQTERGTVQTTQLVVATGGLAAPAVGASDFAWRIAKQFDLTSISPSPALVPLVFDAQKWRPYSSLAGISLSVRISIDDAYSKPHEIKHKKGVKPFFEEDLLFTHAGLSGPAILQISSYWRAGDGLCIDLLPFQTQWAEELIFIKKQSRQLLSNVLTQWLPARLVQHWLSEEAELQKPIHQIGDDALKKLANKFHNWRVYPSGTHGYKKAEATRGGIDCHELSQKTMECKKQKGLYFIGEAVDITGWLGGYNFQWAWSSAYVCAQSLQKNHE